MNALYEIQCDLQKQITNAFVNFMKKSAAKMTTCAGQARLNGLEECYAQFKANHKKIITTESIPKDHPYFLQALFDLVTDSYYDRKGEFLQILADISQQEREQNPPPAPIAPVIRTVNVDHHTLPKMDLPKFSGSFSEWKNFHDLFRSVVHRREDMDSSLKFYYLRTSLTGEAVERIKSIPIAGEQYERAWKALVDYYENKRRIVGTHISNILSVKPMKLENSIELRRVAREIFNPLESLTTLGRSAEDIGNDLIVHLTVEQFDNDTKKDWKKSLEKNDTPPTINQLKAFMESQIETLESIEGKRSKLNFSQSSQKSKSSRKDNDSNSALAHTLQATSKALNKKLPKCSLCNKEHPLRLCEQFLKKPISERREFVQTRRLCHNCLSSGHAKNQCKSCYGCFTCKAKHNTLLHVDNPCQSTNSSNGSTPEPTMEKTTVVVINCSNVSIENETRSISLTARAKKNAVGVLLATARVPTIGPKGNDYIARALIDPCSQVSLITQSLCNRLALESERTHICIEGAGETPLATASRVAYFNIQPYFESSNVFEIEALVLQKLSSYKPPVSSQIGSFDHLKNLQLADPYFADQSSIELLLGASVYAEILLEQVIKGSKSQPVAVQSKLGWLLTGKVTPRVEQLINPTILHCSCDGSKDSQLSDVLHEFWQTEEIGTKNSCTTEDQVCEALYINTTYRNSAGRYVVRFPWKDPEAITKLQIGTSYIHAVWALKRLENNFEKDTRLKEEYCKFIKEYIDLGHMSLVPREKPSKNADYLFLPHHGVCKEASSTTKLRTVFNGSSKLESGESLNDLLYSGSNLLPNPMDLIVSWRNYSIALLADMEKMYRQTEVHTKDRKYQTIIWRFNPQDEIRIYTLNTLTYGLTCSQFLAIRSLLQLAIDHEIEHPVVAQVVREEMYSDNALTGAHSIQEAKEKIEDLIALFEKGSLNLRKWSSSNAEALSSLPEQKLIFDTVTLFTPDTSVPVLGIAWHPKGDYFQFHLENIPIIKPFTKRNVLSRIARTFDPLGWLSPVVIQAKILMQSLWLLKMGWDDELPADISKTWAKWLEELPLIRKIKIPRWSGFTLNTDCVEIHGFSDASKHAYGAVVYLRLLQGQSIKVTLQIAKTRVAPIKTLTIPRLELCAALLLTRLVQQVVSSAKFEIHGLHLWTDSADVLFWLRDHPSRWGVFVGNRCSQIHSALPNAYWYHVRSKENPADVISRGIEPSRLESYELWWKGPSFLVETNGRWSQSSDELNFAVHSLNQSPIYKESLVVINHANSPGTPCALWDLVHRYSTLSKLLCITVNCVRFIKKLLRKIETKMKSMLNVLNLPFFKATETPMTDQGSATELENARLLWCYFVQQAYFAQEIQQIQSKGKVSTKSSIVNLNPVVQDSLLRVGGRLQHALINEEAKHPIILPRSCYFTTLVIRHAHLLTLHGGVQLILGILRRQYWIVRGRAEVKAAVRQCVPCIRYAARSPSQLMGELPSARIRPSLPFTKSGVDYAGPINVRLTKTRGKGTLKGYVCSFVCMATRAVHLEIVEDYSNESFIAAFHRFTSRRGHYKELFSDQGTNFVGADAQLNRMLFEASEYYSSIARSLHEAGTSWTFNPPSAPHFGGLWEAAVRSLKNHLRRVVGEQVLTFSELSTLLCRIEACLNSRPLTKMTDDPSDLEFLSPAHFLIQRSSFLVPEPNYTEKIIPCGKRWQLVSQMTQHFWTKWHAEYLTALQPRSKWLQPQCSPEKGDVVLIKNEITPPGKWLLGQITELHPGSDGLVRVVDIRTATGNLRRPIVKLIPLLKPN